MQQEKREMQDIFAEFKSNEILHFFLAVVEYNLGSRNLIYLSKKYLVWSCCFVLLLLHLFQDSKNGTLNHSIQRVFLILFTLKSTSFQIAYFINKMAKRSQCYQVNKMVLSLILSFGYRRFQLLIELCEAQIQLCHMHYGIPTSSSYLNKNIFGCQIHSCQNIDLVKLRGIRHDLRSVPLDFVTHDHKLPKVPNLSKISQKPTLH